MHRLRDYVGFVVWFAGLGYMAIWPLSASGTSGALFGASVLCHAPAGFGVLAALCRAPHPLMLPPSLHVLGLLSALAAALRLAWCALCRARRARAADANPTRVIRIRANLMPAPPPPKPLPPLPRVKQPRSQFGLRGTPR
jgi:hypothetical protein